MDLKEEKDSKDDDYEPTTVDYTSDDGLYTLSIVGHPLIDSIPLIQCKAYLHFKINCKTQLRRNPLWCGFQNSLGVTISKESDLDKIAKLQVDGSAATFSIELRNQNSSGKLIISSKCQVIRPNHLQLKSLIEAEIFSSFLQLEPPQSVTVTSGDGLSSITLLDQKVSSINRVPIISPGSAFKIRVTSPSSWASDAWVGIVSSEIPHGEEKLNDEHDVQYFHLQSNPLSEFDCACPNEQRLWDLRLNDTDKNGKEVTFITFASLDLSPPSLSGSPGFTENSLIRLWSSKNNLLIGEGFNVQIFKKKGKLSEGSVLCIHSRPTLTLQEPVLAMIRNISSPTNKISVQCLAPFLEGYYSLSILFGDHVANSYEFRVEDPSEESANSLYVTNKKGDGCEIVLEATEFAPGQAIAVTCSHPENWKNKPWIGIVPSHVPHGLESVNDNFDLAFENLPVVGHAVVLGQLCSKLKFTAPLEPGLYDFRLNDSDYNGLEKLSITFKVADQAKTNTTKSVVLPVRTNSETCEIEIERAYYQPGEEILVKCKTPREWPRNAWIGIVPSSVPHGDEIVNDAHDIWYQHLPSQTSCIENSSFITSLSFKAPLNFGKFDLRINDTDDGGREHLHLSFVVDNVFRGPEITDSRSVTVVNDPMRCSIQINAHRILIDEPLQFIVRTTKVLHPMGFITISKTWNPENPVQWSIGRQTGFRREFRFDCIGSFKLKLDVLLDSNNRYTLLEIPIEAYYDYVDTPNSPSHVRADALGCTLILQKSTFTANELLSLKVFIPIASANNSKIFIVPSSLPHGIPAAMTYQLSCRSLRGIPQQVVKDLKAPEIEGSYEIRLVNQNSEELIFLNFTVVSNADDLSTSNRLIQAKSLNYDGSAKNCACELAINRTIFDTKSEVVATCRIPKLTRAAAWIGIVPGRLIQGIHDLNSNSALARSSIAPNQDVFRFNTSGLPPGEYSIRVHDSLTSAPMQEIQSLNFFVCNNLLSGPEFRKSTSEMLLSSDNLSNYVKITSKQSYPGEAVLVEVGLNFSDRAGCAWLVLVPESVPRGLGSLDLRFSLLEFSLPAETTKHVVSFPAPMKEGWYQLRLHSRIHSKKERVFQESYNNQTELVCISLLVIKKEP